jgi:hypothetical protein
LIAYSDFFFVRRIHPVTQDLYITGDIIGGIYFADPHQVGASVKWTGQAAEQLPHQLLLASGENESEVNQLLDLVSSSRSQKRSGPALPIVINGL